jgi:hypothetical protein
MGLAYPLSRDVQALQHWQEEKRREEKRREEKRREELFLKLHAQTLSAVKKM